MRVLVVDVGTSSVRTAIVRPDATVEHEHARALLPESPTPGTVELDASRIAATALELADAALDAAGSADAVGITDQRGSVVVWDRATGTPVAPGIGWQDLRTVGRCLELRNDGLTLAPNHSATKVEWLLDAEDPDRERDLCIGTIDTWMAWTLSGGHLHAVDATNASVTGLATADATDWDDDVLEALRIPRSMLPTIVDSSGHLGIAHALGGAPPITALIGDQQASLVGQGCVGPGEAKITFGTGAMLDVIVGEERPTVTAVDSNGTFALVARRRDGVTTWAREAMALAAGTNVEWLRDDLGVIDSAEQSAAVAGACEESGDVWFVPALLGLGTPDWDYGARGTLLGLTRGTERPQLVRAVLEGIAHRGADLVDAASADADLSIERIRIDGGMSANDVFVQALADASQRVVEVSAHREATTLGAGFLAGLAIGVWSDEGHIASSWTPRARVAPARTLDRERWRQAVARARGWLPDLSAISFG